VSLTRFIALLGCGGALLALTGIALRFQRPDDIDAFLAVVLLQGAVYLAAIWLVWRRGSSRRVVLAIAAMAAIMRIPVALAPPYLSTDVYRYVWDGRVMAAGINPYRYVPADPHLAALRDPEIFPNINRADSAVTIYPPFAEAVFLVVTRISETVTAMKAAMVSFEIVTFVLLVDLLAGEGLPAGRVAVYAWHPLPLWEFAGSGHIDAMLIALAVAALWAAGRGRSALTGLFLAGATLTKLYPVVLFPALYRRWGWAMPVAFAAAIAVGYLPFIGVGWKVFGFLPGYAGEEGFDAGGTGFYLLSLVRHLPGFAEPSGRIYTSGALAILAALGIAIMRSPATAHRTFVPAALLAAIFILLVSPHYPWYFAWLIVFACFIRSLALLWLTIACLLLYLVPVGSHIVRDDYRLAVESMIYGPFAALAAAELWYRCRRPSIGSS
jgi:alpha-1,6-mannosyltransferase